jgi:hypothetical protein
MAQDSVQVTSGGVTLVTVPNALVNLGPVRLMQGYGTNAITAARGETAMSPVGVPPIGSRIGRPAAVGDLGDVEFDGHLLDSSVHGNNFSGGSLTDSGLVNLQELSLSSRKNHRDGPRRLLWKVSLVAFVAAQIMDIDSSWGYRESNPLLRSSSGTFGGRAVGIKAAMTGAATFVEWKAVHKSCASTALYVVANFAGAAVTAGIAGRNYAVRGPLAH